LKEKKSYFYSLYVEQMGCLKLQYYSEPERFFLKVVKPDKKGVAKGVQMFLSVDPMSDNYPSLSPYAYCLNNPIGLIDPFGLEPGDPPKKNKDPNRNYKPNNGATSLTGIEVEAHMTFGDKMKNAYRIVKNKIQNFLSPKIENETVNKSKKNYFGDNWTSEKGHGHESRENKSGEVESENINNVLNVLGMPGKGRLSENDVQNIPKFLAIIGDRLSKTEEYLEKTGCLKPKSTSEKEWKIRTVTRDGSGGSWSLTKSYKPGEKLIGTQPDTLN